MKRKLTAEEESALAAAVVEGLAIQHKFRPEPLYKYTGKGYMKSDGVAELQKLKEQSGGKNMAPQRPVGKRRGAQRAVVPCKARAA